jgi:hypothetical protein
MFCGVVGGLSRALEPADEGNSMIRFYDCLLGAETRWYSNLRS